MNSVSFRLTSFVALLLAVSASDALPADPIPPASERFSAADNAEVPDFQKHLSPLLGKLGCNGRACHGSFQGRGGFRLSLFGYDFKMDHEQLMDRIDTEAPADSYALQKPTLVEPHEGGKRMEVGSWEYNLFLNWVKGGSPTVEGEPLKLKSLEVMPSEIEFTAAGQDRQLRVVAVWADGTREDVTCLSRFQSNDDAICEVTSEGLITSGDKGDSHVVVFYDNAVVPVPIIRPVTDQVGENYPKLAARTPIDEQVQTKLAKLGLVPSEVCTDAEFLRRLQLDLTGTLPSAADVEAFLADSSSDKRARKVDELLQTPAYAAWWTTRLCDWTGCSDQQLQNVNPVNRNAGSADWYAWILKRVSENMPYDQIAEGIVTATSRQPEESYREYCDRMSDYYRDKDRSFADQPGMIYFWGRRNFSSNEDRAIGFAYTFMGTRIQCAQCHKHPFDVWTQQDFEQFEQFFARVRFSRGDNKEVKKILEELGITGKTNGNEQRRAIEKAIADGKTIPFPEVTISAGNDRRRKTKDGESSKAEIAKLLGEQSVDLASIQDPRTALMDWLRNSPTRLFAKSFVNRVWANYFNRGIVEPTDDMSLANPPANAGLLNYLTDGFIAHGYDMKWLHREIVLSDTYQRSWRPNETNASDERNFSRAVVRRMPAEVTYDAMTMATASDNQAEKFLVNPSGRAISDTSPPRNNASNGRNYALSIFGRSIRESNCDCDRSMEASLLQTLYTRNDQDIESLLTARDSWLTQLERESNPKGGDAGKRLAAAKERIARFEKSLAAARKDKNEKLITRMEQQLESARADAAEARQEANAKVVEFDANRVIDQAYLRTLSRYPTEEERKVAAAYLSSEGEPLAGAKDLMWALINTKEFMLNH